MTRLAEHPRREDEFRQERELALAFMDTAEVLVVVLDLEGRIVRFNRRCEQTTGYAFEEVEGQPFWQLFLAPEESEAVQDVFRSLRESDSPSQYENDWLAKDGSRRRITWSNTILTNTEGAVEYVLAIGIDVTELRRAGIGLNESEAFNRSIIDHSLDCIKILDLDGRLKFISEGGRRLLHITDIARYLDLPYDSFWQGSDREATLEALARARSGEVGRFHGYCPTEDGVPRWWDVIISPIVGPRGEVQRLLAVSRDITQQKQAEDALRESETKYRLLVETLHEGIWRIDKDGYTTFVNPRMADMLGCTVDEMVGAHLFRFVDENHPDVKRLMLERRERGIRQSGNIEFRRKDGTRLYANVGVTPVFDADGQYAGALAGIADLTERRHAEEERERLLAQAMQDRKILEALAARLDHQRGTLDTVMESTQAQVAYLDPQLNFVLVNSAYARGSGYAREELIGRNHFELFPNPENQAIFERVRDTGERVEHRAKPFEYVNQPERGITYWDWTLVPVKDALGRLQGLVLSLLDVTDRERSRLHIESLKAQAQRQADELAATFEALAEPVMVLDPTGAILRTNPAAVNSLGFDPVGLGEAALGQRMQVRHPDGRPISAEDLVAVRALRGEKVLDEYQVLVTAGGDERAIVVSAAPIITGGQISGAALAWHDITDLRRSEAALRVSQEKLHAVFEVLPIGISILNEERQVVQNNPALEAILKLPRARLEADNHTHRIYVRSDGTPMPPVEFPTMRALAEQKPVRDQVGVVAEDGSLIWTDVSAAPMPFSDWKVVAAVADITDLRRAEQALQQANDELERRVEERTAILEETNRLLQVDIQERLRIETELRRSEEILELRVDERTHELATLLEISNSVALSKELEPLLGQILDLLKAVVRYDGATIYLLEGDTLKALLHRGPLPAEAVQRLILPVDRSSLAHGLLSTQSVISIPDVRADTPAAGALRQVAGEQFDSLFGYLCAWLGVPLAVKGQVVGLLALHRSEALSFDERDTGLAQAFAGQLAVAVENARLHQQAQEMAAMDERQHLARELHDAVSQTLFSASLAAEVLPRLWDKDRETGLQCLDEVRQLTRGALAEMRTLLLELRPSALAQTELAALLRQLAEAASSRARIPVHVHAEPHCILPPDVQVALYRIAQEALNNVSKHAGAREAFIMLQYVRREPCPDTGDPVARIELSISDDGCGFDLPALLESGTGLGLGIMRERAEAVGATLTIASSPGQGTQLTVTWEAEASQATETPARRTAP